MNRIGTAILLALALGGGGAQARAGDGSAVNVLGFSADGRYFAFEQYGEQDGSGSFYSTITAIEIAGDRLVKGMPVAAIMDPDNPAPGQGAAREAARRHPRQGRRRRGRHAPATGHRRPRARGRVGAGQPVAQCPPA